MCQKNNSALCNNCPCRVKEPITPQAKPETIALHVAATPKSKGAS